MIMEKNPRKADFVQTIPGKADIVEKIPGKADIMEKSSAKADIMEKIPGRRRTAQSSFLTYSRRDLSKLWVITRDGPRFLRPQYPIAETEKWTNNARYNLKK